MFRLLPTIFVFSCLSEKDSRPFVFARGLLLGGMEEEARETKETGGMEEETRETEEWKMEEWKKKQR